MTGYRGICCRNGQSGSNRSDALGKGARRLGWGGGGIGRPGGGIAFGVKASGWEGWCAGDDLNKETRRGIELGWVRGMNRVGAEAGV